MADKNTERCNTCIFKKYKTAVKGRLHYDKCPYPWDWVCDINECDKYTPKQKRCKDCRCKRITCFAYADKGMHPNCKHSYVRKWWKIGRPK